MNQILAAGGPQLGGIADGSDVVLLQDRCRFMKTMLQHLGGLQLGIIRCPLILPVQGQGTEPHQGKTQANQRTGGEPVKAGQKRGLPFNPLTAEGPLDQLQG